MPANATMMTSLATGLAVEDGASFSRELGLIDGIDAGSVGCFVVFIKGFF